MRKFLLGAASAALIAACGGNGSSADFSTAASVLEAMNLEGGDTSRVAFTNVARASDSATFTQLVVKDDEGDDILRADQLEISGMTMDDGAPNFDTLTFSGLEAIGLGETASLTLETLTLEAPNAVTAAYVATLFAGQAPDGPPTLEDWAFEKLSAQGLAFKTDIESDDGAGAVELTLDDATIASLIDMVAGRAELAGLEGAFQFESDGDELPFPLDGEFQLDKMTFDGLRGEWMAAIVEADGDPEALSNLSIAQYFDSPIEPGYDGAVLEDVVLDVSGASLEIPKSTTRVERNGEGVATRVFAPRVSATLDAQPQNGGLGAALGMGLGMMGYETLEFYGESDSRFDPSTDETRVKTYKLGMAEGFDFQMEGGFFNLMDALVTLNSDEPDLSVLEELKIADVSIQLTDKSLFDRAVNIAALTQGQSPEELRSMMTLGLAFGGPYLTGIGVDQDVSQELLTALSAFVEEPGELNISLQPETPVRLGDLAAGDGLTKEALGFTATHALPD